MGLHFVENPAPSEVHGLLDREGWGINIKKVYRIYSELGMQLRNTTPKRRVKAKLRDDRAKAVGPNDVRAMDFASIPQTKRVEDRAFLSRGCGGIATPSLEMALEHPF